MTDLTVVILTLNEEIHIRRCLEMLRDLQPRQIFVIDCFSSDKTQEIAKELGATVLVHAWPGLHAKQFNWALDNCPIRTKWILRLDADEYLYPETIDEIKKTLSNPPEDVTSFSMPLARIWLGRRIKYGTGKVILTRLFRFGKGRCEERHMDEHIVTSEGRNILLKGEFADDNLNDLSWWTKKHIGYAEREAIDLLTAVYGGGVC